MTAVTTRIGFLLVLALSTTGLVEAQEASPKELRIGVLGASVSAGFGCDYRLAEAIERSLGAGYAFEDRASTTFFARPTQKGKAAVDALARFDVDLTVGLDWLFWFASGRKPVEARCADVRRALGELERLPGKIWVGRMPVMKGVSETMMSADRIVPADEIPKVNAVIDAWCEESEDRIALAVDVWLDNVYAARPTALPGGTEAVVAAKTIFTPDGLHLSREGIAFATCMILDSFREHDGRLAEREPLRTIDDVLARLPEKDGDISIDVVDRDGKPVASGVVEVERPDFGEIMGLGLTMKELGKLRPLMALPDSFPIEAGKVMIEGLPSELSKIGVRVRARSGELVSAWAELSVKPGGVTTVRLALTEKADTGDEENGETR